MSVKIVASCVTLQLSSIFVVKYSMEYFYDLSSNRIEHTVCLLNHSKPMLSLPNASLQFLLFSKHSVSFSVKSRKGRQ